MVRIPNFPLAILSALLFALALPNELLPLGSPLIGIFCISPFLASIYYSRDYGHAVWIGMTFGLCFSVLSNFWLIFFQEFSVWTLGGVTFAYVAFHGLLAPVLRFVGNSVPQAYRPFAVAIIWTLYEFFKSSGFLGYPWGLIAYPAHSIVPLIQIASITGIWGLSLLMAMINGIFSEWLASFLKKSRKIPKALWQTSTLVAVIILLAAGYGFVELARPIPQISQIDIVLVQHNRNPWIDGDDERTLAALVKLTNEGIHASQHDPDLVVWSETAVRFPIVTKHTTDGSRIIAPQRLPQLSVPLLTGLPWIVREDPLSAMNSAALFMPGRKLLAHYGKTHLVPFAENVPLWDTPIIQRLFVKVIGLKATWIPGISPTIFSIPVTNGGTLRFATPICFEDTFPNQNRNFVLAGADLLLNITNDAWSRTVSAETQHFVASKLRSVENRRVLIRATNGGVTGIIDPWGRLIGKALPLFEPAVLRALVPIYKPSSYTPYTRFGDYLPPLIGLLLALYLCKIYSPDFLTKWIKKRSP